MCPLLNCLSQINLISVLVICFIYLCPQINFQQKTFSCVEIKFKQLQNSFLFHCTCSNRISEREWTLGLDRHTQEIYENTNWLTLWRPARLLVRAALGHVERERVWQTQTSTPAPGCPDWGSPCPPLHRPQRCVNSTHQGSHWNTKEELF